MAKHPLLKKILDHLVWVSIGLAGIYWALNSIVESLILKKDVWGALTHPAPHEFRERFFMIVPWVLFIVVIRHLVSERTRARKILRAKERSLSTLMRNLPGMAYRSRLNGERVLEYLSDGCRSLTGYAPEELITGAGTSLEDLVHPEDREIVRTKRQATAHDPKHFDLRYRIITASGETRWVWEQGQGFLSPDGKVFVQEGFITDISAQMAAENALKKASDDWRTTFDSARDIILMLNREYRIIKANRAAAQFLGKSYPDIIGRKCYQLFHRDDHPPDNCPLKRLLRSGQHVQKELYFPSRKIWFRTSVDPIHNETGEVIGAVYIARDITYIKEIEDNILKMNREWEETFNILNDAITIHDKDFNIIMANRTAEKMLGLPYLEILGKKCYESYHATPCPPERCPSCRTLKTGIYSVTEVFEPHLNKYIEIKALPRLDEEGQLIGLVHVVRDITKRKISEEEQRLLQHQLIQSRKMDSIGDLAGGVAHDFNNILSAILGYNERSLNMLPADHPVRENLRIVQEAGEKATALTRQLLAFGRQQVLEMRSVNLNVLVENTEEMLHRLIGEDIVLEFHLERPTPNIMADAGQIEHVLMNLAVNARDAMPEGGHLIIETSARTIDSSFPHPCLKIEPAEYVQLTVTDTGAGMSQEMQEKIFEPFRTTGERGKETGLGLATIYGIVRQHQGWIRVYSEAGIGTTFKIILPIVPNEIRQAGPEDRPVLREGTETILVVEDDKTINRMIRITLEPLGYRILSAACADEALTLCRRTGEKIDLILSDVVMPGMNGVELAGKLQGLLPSVPVLLMSGYTDNFIAQYGALNTGFAFLQKPITPAILTNKIRKILDHDREAEKTL